MRRNLKQHEPGTPFDMNGPRGPLQPELRNDPLTVEDP